MKRKSKPGKQVLGADLLARAVAAPRVTRPSDFLPAVDELRKKGYSWRQCAAWLKENAGIETDHANLYRVSENREFLETDGEEEELS